MKIDKESFICPVCNTPAKTDNLEFQSFLSCEKCGNTGAIAIYYDANKTPEGPMPIEGTETYIALWEEG